MHSLSVEGGLHPSHHEAAERGANGAHANNPIVAEPRRREGRELLSNVLSPRNHKDRIPI